jgi:signal transduction histidine kinase
MKKISLRIRITILSGIVLTGMAVILTLVAVSNAQTTYANQYELNFGNGISFKYDNNGVSYNGSSDDIVNGILDFVNGYIEDRNLSTIKTEKGFFSDAGRQFTQKSLGFMVLFVALGILITYYLVGKALKPVRSLSQTVKEINENNLYQKLKEPAAKDEIGSLTDSFNGMMERLNQSFTYQKNFAANAAHELRTPLATMKAGIQVLELDEEPLPEDYKDTIEIIKTNTERMTKVVNDLLELSRSEQGDFTAAIVIDKEIKDIVQELSEKAEVMKVTLRVEHCEGIVEGNETLIYRALYNLVENAVKYNRTGGYVSISSELKEAFVRITVKDNGIGISGEALGHIFEPFYRADRYRTKKVGGSGLGLALVKGIVEKHKGRVSVDSSIDEGTVFEVFLPAKQQ